MLHCCSNTDHAARSGPACRRRQAWQHVHCRLSTAGQPGAPGRAAMSCAHGPCLYVRPVCADAAARCPLQWVGREQDCHLVDTCECRQLASASVHHCTSASLHLLLARLHACLGCCCCLTCSHKPLLVTHTVSATTHSTHHSAALCFVAAATAPAGRPPCMQSTSHYCMLLTHTCTCYACYQPISASYLNAP